MRCVCVPSLRALTTLELLPADLLQANSGTTGDPVLACLTCRACDGSADVTGLPGGVVRVSPAASWGQQCLFRGTPVWVAQPLQERMWADEMLWLSVLWL